jgi:GT2 family glycosyltransferase
MLEVLSNDSSLGLVYASMQEMDAHGKKQDVIHVGPAKHLIFRNVVGACFLYRRCVAEHIGGYNPELFLCEDYEYWLRIATVSKLYLMDTCLYLYRRHNDSLSHNHEKEIIAKGIRVQKQYYRTFVKSQKEAALFYAHLRARDIYNPFRQLYLCVVLFYSPKQFFIEFFGLIKRRFI